MKILVLNGSPKGDNSITLQTVLYLQKHFTEDEFKILSVGQKIKKYEKERAGAMQLIEEAQLILFAYPVYTFIAPYQLARFIELLKAENIDLRGKYAAQISTSKHFFDVTAQKYIQQNCGDLSLKYIGGLSADMDDLLTDKGRKEALDFWEYVHFCAANEIVKPVQTVEPIKRIPYQSTRRASSKSNRYTIALLTDRTDDQNLSAMITDFENAFPYLVKVIDLSKIPFQGGCLGCFRCASTGKCVYTDGFDVFLREQIQTADAIVSAFSIQDHAMGSTFKLYDDRQFCNGHRTVTMGKPTGYIISGAYQEESNLQMIVEGRSEVGGNFLAGVATDEADTQTALNQLAKSLAFALEHHTSLPKNFYGEGGTKIFRDLIYVMRGLMKEDHRFYKAHKIYDFPQKKLGMILKMQAVGTLMSIPSMQRKMGNRMNDEITKPYKKVIAEK